MKFKGLLAIALVICVLPAVKGVGATVESNWADFLHYTAIDKFDLAKGYGEALVASNPDPLVMLELANENPNGYALLVKLSSTKNELTDVSTKILAIIEQGRFARKSDPQIINAEIKRLSTTARGRITALERLKNAGEYAVVYMVSAMQDPARRDELPNIVWALGQLGKEAVGPLVAALQVEDVGVKSEIIRALGQIKYPQAGPYLKFVAEKSDSPQIAALALDNVAKIDAGAARTASAELFYLLGEQYYNRVDSLTPPMDVNFVNIWFWNGEKQSLVREKVNPKYYNELMAMRTCEFALKADPNAGKAIGLWIASFFRAQSTGIAMPEYFGASHPSAMTYATTAGPEYLQQALARAMSRKETYVVLNVVEALGTSGGEKSLMYVVGTQQPLITALVYDDQAVKFSSALAIAMSRPAASFDGADLVAKYLGQALASEANGLSDEAKAQYAMRAAHAMLKLSQCRNKVIDIGLAQGQIITVATDSSKGELQKIAMLILSNLASPDAQRTLAKLALDADSDMQVRMLAFGGLTDSAKMNGNLLTDEQVNGLYEIISSADAPQELRAAASGSYGALNLPSRKVKDFILDQARS